MKTFCTHSFAFGVLLFCMRLACPQSLQDMGDNLLSNYDAFVNLLVNIAYLAGLGFALTAVYKFKQHKDNPAQTSIGTSFAMLGISVFLVFLPGMYGPAGRSLFGSADVSLQQGGSLGAGFDNIQQETSSGGGATTSSPIDADAGISVDE